MSLINCKVELKLRWTKHYVLAVVDVENDGSDSNNIIYYQKRKTLCSCRDFISQNNQKLSNALVKGLKDHCIGIKIVRE